MAIPKFLEDLAIISKLGDNPGADNGLTTAAFRAKFDEAALKIQNYINEVIVPAIGVLNNPEDGLAMKGNISMGGNKITGLGTPTDNAHATTKEYVDKTNSDTRIYVDKKLTTHVLSLPVTSWVENMQTISISGVTADAALSDVIASPDPSDANYAAYGENNVRLVEQLDGAVRFKCDKIPDTALTVNVMVRV